MGGPPWLIVTVGNVVGMFEKEVLVGILEHSRQVLLNVHEVSACEGRACTIHNRSDHHMRGWIQHWRDDRGIMERLCPEHGVGHPDPDSPWVEGDVRWVHGCCGCCTPPEVDIS